MVAGYETDLGDKVGGGTCKLRRAWCGTETIKTEKHRKRVYLGANLPEVGDGWEDMDFKEKGKCANSHHDKNLNYFNREVGLGSQVLKVSAHTHLVLRPLCSYSRQCHGGRCWPYAGYLYSARGCALKTLDFASGPPLNSNCLPKPW